MIAINEQLITTKTFPDNSLLLKINPNNFSEPINITWNYEGDGELFTLICIKRHFDKFYNNFNLTLNYIPHARQDRVKSHEDIFTLKYFCEIINSLNFGTVFVRDAHSNVSLALLNNVHEIPITNFVKGAIGYSEADVLFFPDEGAMKRYSTMFTMPYAFGMKKRDWATGVIQGLDIINAEAVKDKNVLIVDDICSRGGTFYHSAKALKAAGAKNVDLYVSHLEHTVFEGELITGDLINHIYTTNSLCRDYHNDKITVL